MAGIPNVMENEIISLTTKMMDLGKAQGESYGFEWSNRHPTFREIQAAFDARDLKELERIYSENFR